MAAGRTGCAPVPAADVLVGVQWVQFGRRGHLDEEEVGGKLDRAKRPVQEIVGEDAKQAIEVHLAGLTAQLQPCLFQHLARQRMQDTLAHLDAAGGQTVGAGGVEGLDVQQQTRGGIAAVHDIADLGAAPILGQQLVFAGQERIIHGQGEAGAAAACPTAARVRLVRADRCCDQVMVASGIAVSRALSTACLLLGVQPCTSLEYSRRNPRPPVGRRPSHDDSRYRRRRRK